MTIKRVLVLSILLLCIVTPIFAVFADTGSVISISYTSYYGAFLPCNNQMVNAQGRLWNFYERDPDENWTFTSSADAGLTWAANTTIIQGANNGNYWRARTVYYNGSHLAYVVQMTNASAPTWRVFWQMGVLNTDGTITWSADAQQLWGNELPRHESFGLVQTTTGRWFMTYFNFSDSYFYVDSCISTGALWVSDSGYPQKLSATALAHSSSYSLTMILPLSSSQAFAIYECPSDSIYGKLWNGVTWDAQEDLTAQTAYTQGFFSASQLGDTVYIAYAATSSIRFVVRRSDKSLTEMEVSSAAYARCPLVQADNDLSRKGKNYVFIYTPNASRSVDACWLYSVYDPSKGTMIVNLQPLTPKTWIEGGSATAYDFTCLRSVDNGLASIIWVTRINGAGNTMNVFYSRTLDFDNLTAHESIAAQVSAAFSLFTVIVVLAVVMQLDGNDRIWGVISIALMYVVILALINSVGL